MGFEALLGNLSDCPDLKGREFERICKWFLLNAPEYRTQLRRVWLWNDWPGRWAADAGIDLVAETVDGVLWAIQAKAYDLAYAIKKADIDSFLSESARPVFGYRLLIATTDRIGATARRTLAAQEKPAGVLMRSQLALAEVRWPASSTDLRARRPKRKRLRPHQREAVADIVRGFKSTDRGQLVMACGTGKTLTACSLAQVLDARRILVLVPSLSLLAQTLREWTLAGEFDFLAVCSDETVAGVSREAIIATTSELGLPVTTDPTRIAHFLRARRGGRRMRVVFATYQSSLRIVEAQAGRTPPFDLAVADEAHRCAGPTDGVFATILDRSKIRARKRLFMTATPRYFTGRVQAAAMEADWEVASMDDETRFGPVMHRLSFAEAIEKGLLSDYQVAVIGVSDARYRDYAEAGVFVTTDGQRVSDARTLARQIGLLRAMMNYRLRRVVTFHSRIDSASTFARSLPAVSAWLPTDRRPDGRLWAAHVSGKMASSERDSYLARLRAVGDAERAVLSNARCLVEGVDVPALDGVAFIEPRRSQIDVVQAVGRAIRSASGKTVGTVVIPVFVDEDADPEHALESSEFDRVWQVVKALRAHDDELAEQLDDLRRELGRRGTSVIRPSKIHLDLPVGVDVSFARAFDSRLIERCTSSWEEGIGRALAFRDAYGHLRIPALFISEDGFPLGRWIAQRRGARRKGLLAANRIAELDALGICWDPRAEDWQRGIESAGAYRAANGTLRVPGTFVATNGYALGRWINKQRQKCKRGSLSQDQIAELDALGMAWDPFEEDWDQGLTGVRVYRKSCGHVRIPNEFVTADGFRLGSWVAVRRHQRRKGMLAPDRIAALDALGMIWDPFEANWQRGIAAARAYRAVAGQLCPSRTLVTDDGFPLGRWLTSCQARHRQGTLTAERISELEALGVAWGRGHHETWVRGLGAAQAFHAANGHLRIPQLFVAEDAFRLGRWISRRSEERRSGVLAASRIAELDALGMIWDINEEDWRLGMAAARAYRDTNRDLRVPQNFVDADGYPLGNWIGARRAERKKRRLTPQRTADLDSLGMVWDGLDEPWRSGIAALRKYRAANHDLRVPAAFITDGGFPLGRWVAKRRSERRNGKLTAERVRELEGLGMLWEPRDERWQQGLAAARIYRAANGHLAVPTKFVADDGFSLGNWIAKHRESRRKGTLPANRLATLDSLGMIWERKLLTDLSSAT